MPPRPPFVVVLVTKTRFAGGVAVGAGVAVIVALGVALAGGVADAVAGAVGVGVSSEAGTQSSAGAVASKTWGARSASLVATVAFAKREPRGRWTA